jgi:Fur family ferric uptake transcriptional regulator
MKNIREKELEALLKKHGHKITQTRLLVLDIFSKNKSPLSAEQVQAKATKITKVDSVTIYRSLASFEKSGILKKVNLLTGTIFFERADDHHHHVVCTECGHIEDFKDCSIGGMIKKVLQSSPNFSTIKDHSVELFGVCNICSA